MSGFARISAVLLLACLAGASVRSAGSPVQKVVELLDECKAKIDRDLAAESQSFNEFATFCDDESSDKTHAIEVTSREIADISASIEDYTAQIANLGDEITELGSVGASKQRELYEASTARETQHSDFIAEEAEMIKSIQELSGAVEMLKKGASFAQVRGGAAKKAKEEADVLGKIIDAQALDLKGRSQLKAFLQAKKRQAAADDDDLDLDQATAAHASLTQTGGDGIGATMENMQSKAEDTLSNLRKKEMENAHTFQMVKAGLEDEIAHTTQKHGTATGNKAAAEEAMGNAEGNLAEANKSKAADVEYLKSFKMDCQNTAKKWEERQRSSSGELGAIAKAKEILVGGVKAAFLQVAHTSLGRINGDDDSEVAQAKRQQLVSKLRGLSQDHKSFALSQLANMAASDPFGKIRGLIEGMIEKLMKKAQEEATHEAFCQEEMGKSTKSQEEKSARSDEYQTRIDSAQSSIMQLSQAIKGLEAEIAETDGATAEATKVRSAEHADFVQASADFRDSATAVARAIEVLKDYYNGASLAQISSHTTRANQKQPDFGSAQGDSAHTIISVLEMSEEDFTSMLAEVESQEDQAAKSFAKLQQESKISRATKVVDVKAKESEVKSLKVSLAHHTEDHQAISEELESVNRYLAKLKPQCETKTMSYGEKKAAREAEIEGLKDALSILEGDAF